MYGAGGSYTQVPPHCIFLGKILLMMGYERYYRVFSGKRADKRPASITNSLLAFFNGAYFGNRTDRKLCKSNR